MKLKIYVGIREGYKRTVIVDSLRFRYRYVRQRDSCKYSKYYAPKDIDSNTFEYFDEIEEEDLEITLTTIALLGGT